MTYSLVVIFLIIIVYRANQEQAHRRAVEAEEREHRARMEGRATYTPQPPRQDYPNVPVVRKKGSMHRSRPSGNYRQRTEGHHKYPPIHYG